MPEDPKGLPPEQSPASQPRYQQSRRKLGYIIFGVVVVVFLIGVWLLQSSKTKSYDPLVSSPSVPTPTRMVTMAVESPISGEVLLYRLEFNSITVQVDASSTAGVVVGVKVWAADEPEPEDWQDFQELVTIPWEFSTQTINVRFADDQGNVSDIYHESTVPPHSPPSY